MADIKLNIVDRLKERAENADRQKEKGFINDKTGTSIRMSEEGNVAIVGSKNVQYRMSYASGHASEISMESNTVANRKNIKVDELIINTHKFNPQLYELTDMKQYLSDPTQAIGNLTMCGTVLVKAWEPSLEKWVLIRRPIRTPIFSNLLDIPKSPDEMGLSDNISDELVAMRKTGLKFV